MLKRSINKGEEKDDPMVNTRTILLVLIFAAVIAWIGPILLTTNASNLSDIEKEACNDEDVRKGLGFTEQLRCIEHDTETMFDIIMNIIKYILLVASIAVIVVMRVNPHHTHS